MKKLLEIYLECIGNMERTDYGDRASVRLHNQSAKKVRKIAIDIDRKFPELKAEFQKLLLVERSEVRIWTAHLILEEMTYDKETQNNSLQIIEDAASGDGFDAMGNRIWLSCWKENHQNEF